MQIFTVKNQVKEKLILVTLLCIASFYCSAQSIKYSFYLQGPQYLFPEKKFGFNTSQNNIESLNRFGVGGAFGGLFYFDNDDNPNTAMIGVDFTFVELCFLHNDIKGDDFASTGRTNSSETQLMSTQIGPIVSIHTFSGIYLDIFCQGQFGQTLSSSVYSNESYNSRFRVNSGIGIGLSKYYMHLEYNFGNPQVKEIDYSGSTPIVNTYKINHSYIKFTFTLKFHDEIFEQIK